MTFKKCENILLESFKFSHLFQQPCTVLQPGTYRVEAHEVRLWVEEKFKPSCQLQSPDIHLQPWPESAAMTEDAYQTTPPPPKRRGEKRELTSFLRCNQGPSSLVCDLSNEILTFLRTVSSSDFHRSRTHGCKLDVLLSPKTTEQTAGLLSCRLSSPLLTSFKSHQGHRHRGLTECGGQQMI